MLTRLNIPTTNWLKIVTEFGQLFHGSVDTLQALSVYCEHFIIQIIIQIEINGDGTFQIAANLYISKAEKTTLSTTTHSQNTHNIFGRVFRANYFFNSLNNIDVLVNI